MSAPDSCAYPVGTRVRIGTHQGTVHPPQPRVTVLIDGGEIAEVPALCVHLAEGQAPAEPIVNEANNALRELSTENERLRERVAEQTEINQGWVRYGARVKAERGEWADAFRLALGLDDFDRTRHIPLLIEKAAAQHAELVELRAGVVRLSAEASLDTIPDDAEAQFAGVLHAAGCVDPCPGHCQSEASTLLDLVRGWSQTPDPAAEATRA